jgi:hypothetical protein
MSNIGDIIFAHEFLAYGVYGNIACRKSLVKQMKQCFLKYHFSRPLEILRLQQIYRSQFSPILPREKTFWTRLLPD